MSLSSHSCEDGGEGSNEGCSAGMIDAERAQEVVVPGPLEERSLEDEMFEAVC